MKITKEKQLELLYKNYGNGHALANDLILQNIGFKQLFGVRTPEPAFAPYFDLEVEEIKKFVESRFDQFLQKYKSKSSDIITQIEDNKFRYDAYDRGELFYGFTCNKDELILYFCDVMTKLIPKYFNIWNAPK